MRKMINLINIEKIKRLSQDFQLPVEDVLFIALNIFGVDYKCDYNRMRMALHINDDKVFNYSKNRRENDYYFALAINNQEKDIFNK